MRIIFLLLSLLFFSQVHAIQEPPLPADQAFKFFITIPKKDLVYLNWQIAPNYYLYAKKMEIKFPKNMEAKFKMPQGEFEYDKSFGKYEAYANQINIPVLLRNAAQQIQIKLNYQGCSKAGFCYPPISKKINLNLAMLTSQEEITNHPPVSSSTSSLITNQQEIKTWLTTKKMSVMLFVFLGLGLLLAFTPCVLPMIPILASIIAGNKTINTKKAFFLSLSYVLGIAVTYALIGLVAAYMGQSLQVWLQKPIIVIFTCLLFLLLALSLFGLYDLRLPHRWQTQLTIWSNQQKAGTFIGVFLMGVLSTLIVSPCVTAPLVGVLLYIADTGNLIYGATALFMLGIGMGLPLLLLGCSMGKLLPKAGNWMHAIKKIFGLIMIAMAVWLFTRVEMHPVSKTSQSFIVVHNENELKQQLVRAQTHHQPVILDFYADWCESCVMMDKNVFSLTDVQQKLKNYVLLRADLSENTEPAESLLKSFQVIAPPTVLFFNEKGTELNAQRIVGEVSATEFLNRLPNFEDINAS